MPIFQFPKKNQAPDKASPTSAPEGKSNSRRLAELVRDGVSFDHENVRMSGDRSNSEFGNWLDQRSPTPSNQNFSRQFGTNVNLGNGATLSANSSVNPMQKRGSAQIGVAKSDQNQGWGNSFGINATANANLKNTESPLGGSVNLRNDTTRKVGNGQFRVGANGTVGTNGNHRGMASLGLSQTDKEGALWNANMDFSTSEYSPFRGSLRRNKGARMEQLSVDQSGVGMWVSDKEKRASLGGRVSGQGVSVDASKAYTMKNGRVSGNNGNLMWNIVDSQTNASAQMGKVGPSVRASSRHDVANVNGNAELFRAKQNVLDQKFEAFSQVFGNAGIGAQARGHADFKRGVDLSAGGFAGAKAGAKIDAAVEWNREDNYDDVLREHLDNIPGKWDDKLLEKIPTKWLEMGAQAIFGRGRSRLISGSVGADVRAGVGFEAGASAKLEEDGLFSVGGNLSGSTGVGTGVAGKFGINPVALGQLGMLKSMECVNKGYDALEKIPKAVCRSSAQTAAKVGSRLQEESEKGGLMGGASDLLLGIDRKVRGLDKA